jgi:glutamine phosphoribosylpyrophosphate amidotransferase
MCGVIGYSSDEPSEDHRAMLRRLFYESRVRGIHAFGFSFWDGAGVVTQRFARLEDCLAALPQTTTRLIGHCRYSTSGDYATMENNQPIQAGDTAMAFNGVISMATKPEYEQEYGRRYDTENDGEIFLDKFVRNDGWEEFVAGGRFSFAGLVLHRDQLVALRNSRRPLYRCDEAGGRFYASTADIFRRAGFRTTPDPMPPGVACRAA